MALPEPPERPSRGGEGDGPEGFLPTLGEILDRDLPPLPVPPGGWEGVLPMLGSLPSALDREYLGRLLEEEDLAQFRDSTPEEVLFAFEERQAALRPRPPERDPLCRRLAVLAGFAHRWLGNPAAAFYALYHTTDNGVCAPGGGGVIDVETRRARGMAVPLLSKRHIAIRDLTRLLELDPDNRDVYLLCRGYLYTLDPKAAAARRDLEELAGLGGVARDDPRLNFAPFDPEFLARPGVLRRSGGKKKWKIWNLLLDKLRGL